MSKEKMLVSYCMVTYNEEKFIKEALYSAFSQDYSPMEIVICDDCSTDNTFAIIEEEVKKYTGDKKIVYVRNEKNLGVRENYNKVLYDLSKGDIIIFGDGDDISISSRTSDYVKCFEDYPDVMSISCLSDEISENGISLMPKNFEWSNSRSIYSLEDYVENTYLTIYSGDSRGLRRCVVDKFPRIQYAISEDTTLFIRSLLLGSGCYLRFPYVKRRHHDNNVSKRPMDKSVTNLLKKQLNCDVDWAYNHGYISSPKKEKICKKIVLISKLFNIYNVSGLSGIKPFVYRVLKKVFKVKLFE